VDDEPAFPSRVEPSQLEPADEPAATLITELQPLAARQERLLASLRELPPAPPPSAPVDASGVVGVAAGPLETTDALRTFQRALSGLDGFERCGFAATREATARSST
jgi:hypothetical protein